MPRSIAPHPSRHDFHIRALGALSIAFIVGLASSARVWTTNSWLSSSPPQSQRPYEQYAETWFWITLAFLIAELAALTGLIISLARRRRERQSRLMSNP